MPRLRRADTNEPGLTRRGRGRGFEYLDPAGRPVRDPETLQRIRSLAIPPAWRDVWICTHPFGHIQAMGTDDAGRRQYLYHPRWRERRDREKFERMMAFARALPSLRRQVAKDLEAEGMPRERVLACAVRLLDLGFFRIGSEAYAEENGTFGLATLRKEHVTVGRTSASFDYSAKGGARRVLEVADPAVLPVLRTLKRRRSGGDELLAFRAGRDWVDLRSPDINDYIKERTGGDFTAKDFRTWSGTLLAAVALAGHADGPATRTARKRQISAAVRVVSGYLGNTPAVCRASYIDPRVIDRFIAGDTIAATLRRQRGIDPSDPATLHGALERATIALLEDEADRAAA